MLTAQKMLVNIYKDGLFSQDKDTKKVKYWEDMIKKDIKDTNFEIYKLSNISKITFFLNHRKKVLLYFLQYLSYHISPINNSL